MNGGTIGGMFWHGVTRMGEGPILLPAALLAAWLLALQRGNRRTAGIWLVSLGLAVLVTLASKFAFLGWGLGWAALNFSGVSGHAMMAAAVYPVLFAALIPTPSALGRGCTAGAGIALASLVGISRVVVGAHSWSEVIAGLAMGGVVTAVVLSGMALATLRSSPRMSFTRLLAAPLALGLWLTMMPAFGPSLNSHSMITEWSLRLSGRSAPYTRGEMLRELRRGGKAASREPHGARAFAKARPSSALGYHTPPFIHASGVFVWVLFPPLSLG